MQQRAWIVFSGILWLLIGSFLLQKGLHWISVSLLQPDSLLTRWQGVFGTREQAGTALIGFSLLIGFCKGRFVLSKTVRRVVARLASLKAPIRFREAYAPSYWILIGSMIALGMLFRFLPLPSEIRGAIDIAIGSALIQGAILYFRAARAIRPLA